MSWETKRNGRRYYYEARRENGRVVKRYVGCGEVVEASAGLDRIARDKRKAAAMLARRRRDQSLGQIDQFGATVEQFSDRVATITRAALTTCGYRQHKRGEWRRSRMTATQKAIEGKVTYRLRDEKEIAMMKRAQNGDTAAVPAMRRVLDEICAQNGGKLPARMATASKLTEAFTRQLSGVDDLLLRECIIRETEQMRDTVAGPNPTPLESLLAERIAFCYLHVQYAEVVYQGTLQQGATSHDQAPFLDRIDGAQRRYLAAIKMLAQVRRIQIPTLQMQVNIGDKQINRAG
jgi:hypothetical protein